MNAAWCVIESGRLSPEAIMAKDANLLAECDPTGSPLLHFYEWNAPCLTFGYFTDPAHHLNLGALQLHGIEKARRPTGGGIIFHLSDLAFSLIISANHPQFSMNTLENYHWINRLTAEAVASFTQNIYRPELFSQKLSCTREKGMKKIVETDHCFSFCMAKPTQYDLVLEGKKVGGAAQRKTKRGLLHQGSLSLLFPPRALLLDILKEGKSVVDAMEENSYTLLPVKSTMHELHAARDRLKEILRTTFCTS